MLFIRTTPKHLLTALTPCLLLVLTACGPGDLPGEFEQPTEREQQAITDGQSYSGHPSVGRLMAYISGGVAGCTATLVGTRTVLTAAHCIKQGATHRLQLAGATYNVQTTIQHHSYDRQTIANDIGVVILSSAPPVTPSEVSQQAPTVGLKLTLIGYGNTRFGAKDSGIKRIAVNKVDRVFSTRFTFVGTGNGFGSTCEGDSGGPAFLIGGKEVQVGVTSAGTQPCGSTAIDTRVDAYIPWLKQVSNGDLWKGKPDKEKPRVNITSPADRASVRQAFSVKVNASDDVGVTSVTLHLDGKQVGRKTAPPYTFNVSAALGDRTLRAEARDASGKQATHQIAIKVVPPQPFGARCSEHLDCKSGICAGDPLTGAAFCTQLCKPQNPACPNAGPCLPTGSKLNVCGLTGFDAGDDGSCSLAPAGEPAPSALWGIALLLALALTRTIRRLRRRP